MDEEDNFALVPRPPALIEKARPGAKRVLAVIVEDMLDLASVDGPTSLFRKGRAYLFGKGVSKDIAAA